MTILDVELVSETSSNNTTTKQELDLCQSLFNKNDGTLKEKYIEKHQILFSIV